MRARLPYLFPLILALSGFGCAGSPAVSPKTPDGAVSTPAPTPERADFPKTAHRLLLSRQNDAEAKLELAGLAQYQLQRAERLFENGYDEAAEDQVIGALLLLRHDDPLPAAIMARQTALLQAAHIAARDGDAGRAAALYELTLAVAEDDVIKSDVREHLEAMAHYRASTRSKSRLLQSGVHTRASLSRAMLNPELEAFENANRSVIEWLSAALASSAHERDLGSRSAREEALEAYRAVRSGAPGLVAVCLRQGDPLRAIETLDEAGMIRALPGGVSELLRNAAKDDAPDAWLDLFRIYDTERRQESAESSLPPYVADGAALWSAIGLYRSSPGDIEHAMPLAMSLVEFGMPEVASAILAQNINPETNAEALSWSISLVLRGLLELGRTDQIEAARLSVDEAEPLLAMARAARFEKMAPHPAGVYSLLASFETRLGFTERALPLLERAARNNPRTETRLRLAELHRQAGRPDEALTQLRLATSQAAQLGNVLAEARAQELIFQLERDRDDNKAAAEALDHALQRTLTARAMDLRVVSEAAVERLLARLLEHYGESRGARRAFERALEASRRHPEEIEPTLTDMARSALTSGDVRLARLATRSALDLGLSGENLVYIAIWQRLVEKASDSPADGLTSQILNSTTTTDGWTNQLRHFVVGQLDAATLAHRANTIPEKTEARFYGALWQHGLETPSEALLEVAKSSAIDLIEVTVARDLLAKERTFALPSDVVLP